MCQPWGKRSRIQFSEIHGPPAERLEGEEGADDCQGEEECAVERRLLARLQGLLRPGHDGPLWSDVLNLNLLGHYLNFFDLSNEAQIKQRNKGEYFCGQLLQ